MESEIMIRPNDTSYINCKTTLHTMEWLNMIFRGKLNIIHTTTPSVDNIPSCQLCVGNSKTQCRGAQGWMNKKHIVTIIYSSQVKATTVSLSNVSPPIPLQCWLRWQTHQPLIQCMQHSTVNDGTASIFRISFLARPIECSPN